MLEKKGVNMKKLAVSIGAGLAAVAVSMGISISEGISWYICLPIGLIMGVVISAYSFWEFYSDKKSFDDAKRLKSGQMFKSDASEERYRRRAAKHEPAAPKGSMLSDMIARYRSPAIAYELLGTLALGLIVIILIGEEKEGKSEPFVKYIVIGGMVLLLYLAVSGIIGLKARRFYLKLSDRPDFGRIERSYMGSRIIGSSGNVMVMGDEFITLLVPNMVIPMKRSEIETVRRAAVLGGANYNGTALGTESEQYFINFYLPESTALSSSAMPAVYKIKLSKFDMQRAYDLLKENGLPAEETIDLH